MTTAHRCPAAAELGRSARRIRHRESVEYKDAPLSRSNEVTHACHHEVPVPHTLLILFLCSAVWAADPRTPPDRGAAPAKPRAEDAVLRTVYSINLDRQTPNRVQVVTENLRDGAVKAFIDAAFVGQPRPDLPRPAVFGRASQFAERLREKFGSRVTLLEIDLRSADGVGFGLAIHGGVEKDLAGFEDVRRFLAKNEAINTIESGSYRVDGCVDDATLARLAECFPDVRKLRLFGCPITGAALPTIGKWTNLELLSVQRANMASQPLTPLGNLSALQSLDLVDTSTSGSLEFLTKLRVLDRLSCKTDDANTQWIGKLTQLRSLDLCGSAISDSGLKQLAGLTQLEELGLQNSNITDAGLVHVSKMSKLHFLNLDGTRLTGVGLPDLRDLPLSQLQMQGTQLTGENWIRNVPNFRSYDAGLMMITRDSRITPDEAARIRKLIKGSSQAFLHNP